MRPLVSRQGSATVSRDSMELLAEAMLGTTTHAGATRLIDSNNAHTRNSNVIAKAKQNHVTIICLPPHSSHNMQPLDAGFIFPLKSNNAREIENFLKQNDTCEKPHPSSFKLTLQHHMPSILRVQHHRLVLLRSQHRTPLLLQLLGLCYRPRLQQFQHPRLTKTCQNKSVNKTRPKKRKTARLESSEEDYFSHTFSLEDSSDGKDDIDDNDAECIFSAGLWSEDKSGEEWRQCRKCYMWTHQNCGANDKFICPNCLKATMFDVKYRAVSVKTLVIDDNSEAATRSNPIRKYSYNVQLELTIRTYVIIGRVHAYESAASMVCSPASLHLSQCYIKHNLPNNMGHVPYERNIALVTSNSKRSYASSNNVGGEINEGMHGFYLTNTVFAIVFIAGVFSIGITSFFVRSDINE
ncbi:hypothetical protein PR048_012552 [Dryococelus australis]|uniref:DDE-1 domain-containing protein n=1 Tax=Dryococelus australis TaxID=614101 RepID=A0ABQ9HQI5_9NEOP|nr:hypothetical protein PR048_012552 [Dryococelus australis]